MKRQRGYYIWISGSDTWRKIGWLEYHLGIVALHIEGICGRFRRGTLFHK